MCKAELLLFNGVGFFKIILNFKKIAVSLNNTK